MICYTTNNEVFRLLIGNRLSRFRLDISGGVKISSFATTQDGKITAIYIGNEIIVSDWDTETTINIPVIAYTYEYYVRDLYISTDSKYIIAKGHCIQIWSINDQKCIALMALNYRNENHMCITPDFSRCIVTEGGERYGVFKEGFHKKRSTTVWSFISLNNKTNNYWNTAQNCISTSAKGTVLASFGMTYIEDRVQELTLLSNSLSQFVVEKIALPSSDYSYISASKISLDEKFLIISHGVNTLLIN